MRREKDDHEVFLNPDFKKMVLTQFSDQLVLYVQESKRALTLGNKRSDALKDALCSLFCYLLLLSRETVVRTMAALNFQP